METASLERIGLTRNESLVYLSLLKLGTSKTGEILKESHLNSGKIYEILEGLKIKGLVSESVINNVKHFTAASPNQILEYIEKKKQELQKDEEEIKTFLPNLEKIRNVKPKGLKAVVYTGFRGIKTAAEEALDSMKQDQEILAMGITKFKDPRFNEFWKQWSKKRIGRKIEARHIFSERSDYLDFFKKMRYTQAKVLTAFTPVALNVFGEDRTIILNYPEPSSCIVIYDKNTTTSVTTFFEQLWKIAKD